jgi:hypothetical protein
MCTYMCACECVCVRVSVLYGLRVCVRTYSTAREYLSAHRCIVRVRVRLTMVTIRAIPSRLYSAGPTISAAVCLILSDGDGQEITAIDNAIHSGVFPNAKRRRGVWHLVHQAIVKEFGSGAFDDENLQIVKAWCMQLARNTETEAEATESLAELRAWVGRNFDTVAHRSFLSSSSSKRAMLESSDDWNDDRSDDYDHEGAMMERSDDG